MDSLDWEANSDLVVVLGEVFKLLRRILLVILRFYCLAEMALWVVEVAELEED
jgi:hypothetical protein